ncbi:hypothetical protein EBS02_11890, partial [bacterium]|nr:hypothetical protein [bacterium]
MNILKYFKLSLKEVLFSLISSFCIVLGFFSYKVYYYDWYESFFIALKTQNIKHYRLLQFIDKPHLPQEQEHDLFSQEWIEIMTSIQNAFVRAQHSDPDLDLSVEL